MMNIPGINMNELRLQGFRVHELAFTDNAPVSRGRRDFYKMGIVNGDMMIHYGEKVLEINGTVLFFVNPNVSHAVLRRGKKNSGYACLFTDTFSKRTEILKNSPLFNAGDNPVIPLNREQATFITAIFQKMLAVHNEEYLYKADLIRSCIDMIIHEALQIQPSQSKSQFHNAAARTTHLFIDLLERQFPIERITEPLTLKTAQDYANKLSLHVNYLNRCIKETTGKPTSVHIAERIASEAKTLLLHTDWSITEIAYALGFEYSTYFNNFFKRVTGTKLKSFREKKV